jgi:hypothetical protein
LFGGPRGCTHTTALLQAMAPVAVQCFWSMMASEARTAGGVFAPRTRSGEDRSGMWKTNLNTCHVWAEDGDMVQSIVQGAPVPLPIFARRRAAELALDLPGAGEAGQE